MICEKANFKKRKKINATTPFITFRATPRDLALHKKLAETGEASDFYRGQLRFHREDTLPNHQRIHVVREEIIILRLLQDELMREKIDPIRKRLFHLGIKAKELEDDMISVVKKESFHYLSSIVKEHYQEALGDKFPVEKFREVDST